MRVFFCRCGDCAVFGEGLKSPLFVFLEHIFTLSCLPTAFLFLLAGEKEAKEWHKRGGLWILTSSQFATVSTIKNYITAHGALQKAAPLLKHPPRQYNWCFQQISFLSCRHDNLSDSAVIVLLLGVEHIPVIVSQLHRREIQKIKMTAP